MNKRKILVSILIIVAVIFGSCNAYNYYVNYEPESTEVIDNSKQDEVEKESIEIQKDKNETIVLKDEDNNDKKTALKDDTVVYVKEVKAQTNNSAVGTSSEIGTTNTTNSKVVEPTKPVIVIDAVNSKKPVETAKPVDPLYPFEPVIPSLPVDVVDTKDIFIIERESICGLTKHGTEILKSADVKELKIPDGMKTIKKDALCNLGLTNLIFPKSLTLVEKQSIDGNDFVDLYIPNKKCKVNGIVNNNQYVNIITPSDKIKDTKVEGGYGFVVNRASVQVLYKEEDGSLYEKQMVVADHLTKRTSHDLSLYYKIGDEVSVKPNVCGYAEQYPHSVVIDQPVVEDEFVYRGEKIFTELLDESLKLPQILGAKDRILIQGEYNSGLNSLLKGVKAFDYKGNDITDELTIKNKDEIEQANGSNCSIVYSVKDKV